ncbi:MAG: cation:proton antiporter [Polyangiaceae bacterium]
MSAPRPKASPRLRMARAAGLALLFGLAFVASRAEGAGKGGEVLLALGLFVLGGTLAAELLEPLKVPHLTGYLAVGVLAGPHVLHLVDHDTVESMTKLNALALALIAFAGGVELKLDLLRKGLRSLTVVTLLQTGIVLFGTAAVFALARPWIPFVQGMDHAALAGVALLWGILAVTRSPSATLGVLAQTRAKGPLTSYTLAFVMSSDVVVVVLSALVIAIAKPLTIPGAELTMSGFHALGHELLGSVALGTTLGLVMIAYLRFVGKKLLVVLVALGFGFTEVLSYLRLEPLLTFLVAGFLVQNLSPYGEKLLHAIEDMASVVYVVFFATAGAHLDLPLLQRYWVVALVLFAARFVLTYGASRLSSRLANDPPAIRTWGFAGLVSQAGVTIALAATIERAFPSFGPKLRSLAIATVALCEVAGPVLFKMALDATKESEAFRGDPGPASSSSPKSS